MQQKKKNTLILIIDTDIQALRQLGTLLRELGDVVFATSAKAGLFMAHQRKPDVVLCAAELGDTNGADLCRRLKGSRGSKDATVIMLAKLQDDQLELAALEAGAVDYIAQPWNPKVLVARIKTHLTLSRQQNLLQLLADKDGLTEVYNRRYFENQARVELKRHYRQQQALTLVLLDIDHFKAYNDAYGHLQGDICLREVAQAIDTHSRRPGEFVARYGGEEPHCQPRWRCRPYPLPPRI